MHISSIARKLTLVTTIAWALTGSAAPAADWPEWRGPNRDGRSAEKNLPSKWSPKGENLAWKVPYGGRSTPIVMGDRIYLLNPSGSGETLQERLTCFDAESGKVLWEYKYNVFLSDVPPHRVAWSSPAGDPETGNVYVFGVGGSLIGFSRDGKVLWDRSLGEEFGLVTTHGGRTVSPVVDGDLVIVSGITSGWGDQARAAHRFMAFDKRTGKTVYVSTPGGRPFDTTYSPPIIADVNGTRLLIAGGGDGTMHAIKVQTGEPAWKYVVSKRGLNTGAVMNGNVAIVTHSEENLDTSEMGLIAAIDASVKGDIKKENVKWEKTGWQGGFSSPIVEGDRIFQVDNGGNLYAFDSVSGKSLWHINVGTVQKASAVLADGKIYVGSETGKFFIVRPHSDKAEIVYSIDLNEGKPSDASPEQIIASVAVADGRVYLVSNEAMYAIGKRTPSPPSTPATKKLEAGQGPAAFVLVVPTELTAKPGEKLSFEARGFDAQGRPLGVQKATWAVEQMGGNVDESGSYTAPQGAAAGLVKATVGGVSGTARVRVIPPLPWSENFDAIAAKTPPKHWINATGKTEVREVDGNKVLVKLADNPFTKRARIFLGPTDLSNYTVEVDARAIEKRRQMGDAGVVAQRYQLTLYGNHQRLELQPWQPETTRTVAVPFPWKADTWYHIKLRVEPAGDGKVKALGKAWPTGEPEPEKWSIERIDPISNLHGSPGLYADATFEVFFDNLKVTANQ
jgi:outer membrane protein assembly factor BamB